MRLTQYKIDQISHDWEVLCPRCVLLSKSGENYDRVDLDKWYCQDCDKDFTFDTYLDLLIEQHEDELSWDDDDDDRIWEA